MSIFGKFIGLTLAAVALLAPGVVSAEAPADQATNAVAAPPPAAAPAASPAAAPPVAPATPPAPPSQTPAPPTPPVAAATQPPIPVVLIITPELRAIVWTHTPELFRPMYQLGDVNNLGQATDSALEGMLKNLPLDVHVVASADEAQKVSGARYVIVPTVQRYEEHNEGITTFAPFTETIVVEWKVTDGNGGAILLDTVLATATGKLGNNFISQERAQSIENRMLDDLMAKSKTLLQPVLVGPAA